MPFTPAHILAVLPARRLPMLVPSALVIGAVVPDVPYYLPVEAPREVLHSWLGALTWTALLALILWALWEAVFAEPMRDLAPDGLRRRLAPASSRPAARMPTLQFAGAVYASFVLGVATHLAWDGLTHDPGWGTRLMPWLLTPAGGLWLLNWVQLGSSVVGLGGLALWARGWWRSTPQVQPPARVATATWATVARVLLVGAPTLVGLRSVWLLRRSNVMDMGYYASIHAGATLVAVTCLVVAWWWASRGMWRRTGQRSAERSAGEPAVDVPKGSLPDRIGSPTRPQ